MKTRLVAWIRPGLILAVTGPGLSACVTAGLDFNVQAAYFRPRMDGNVGLESTGGGLFDDVSLGDLGLDDYEDTVHGRVDVGLLGFNLAVSGFEFSQSGSGDLAADFGDITVGTTVSSRYDLKMGRGALTYSVIDLAGIRLAPGIGVEYADLDFQVEDSLTSTTERVDSQVWVPMVVVQGEVDVPVVPVRLLADVGGIRGHYDDLDGTFLDVEAFLYYDPVDFLSLFVGYRYISVDSEGSSSGQQYDADVDLQGWMVGGSVRF